MDWKTVADAFDSDGALRDIYIFDTSIREWQAVYDAIRRSCAVAIRGASTLPTDVRELFPWDGRRMITVDMEGILFNCHFFGEDEIEFDFSPNHVKSQADLDKLCGFLALVGNAAKKEAVLTVENCKDLVILRFNSAGEVVAGNFTAGTRLH